MPKNLWLLAVALVVSSCSTARAAAEDHWEFGVDQGMAYPLRNNTFQHDIPNSALLVDLGQESLGDEAGEGFVIPPLTGASRVASTLKPMTDLGAHVYYRLRPDIQIGLEGGYGFNRSTFLDQRGIWGTSQFLNVTDKAELTHFTPMVKWSHWWHYLRPSFGIGPGWYLYHEVMNVQFVDADDPQVGPLNVVNQTLNYTGIAVSAGLSVKVAKHGSIDLSCQYNKVFGGGGKLDFILPKAGLSVFFGGESWY